MHRILVSDGRSTGGHSRVSDVLDRHLGYILLVPVVVVFVALTLYPLGELVMMALSTIRFENAADVWTFTPGQNLHRLLSDEIFRTALHNTVLIAAIGVTIEIVLGLGLAILVASVSSMKGLVRTVLIIPILMPAVAIGSMWKLMYSLDFGVLNQIAGLVGLAPINWLGTPMLAFTSVILVDVWHWTPFVFLILFAAIEAVPEDILEAARMDGAGNRAVIIRIVIPLIWPTLVVALVFRTVLSFKMFDQVFLLTSGGPGTATEVVSLRIYKVFFQQNEMGYGATLSIAVILATVAFIWVSHRAGRVLGGR